MRDVIDGLRHEHRTLGALLGLVELEVDVFETGARPDYETVRDILHYLLTYPEQVHHPLEDVIVERLRPRAPEVARAAGDLGAEHAEVTALLHRFDAALEQVLCNEVLPRDWFAGLGRGFAAAYRTHMAEEEAVLFPAARRHLDAADWEAVEAARNAGADPLAGGNADARPEHLMLRARLRDEMAAV